jgi:hypothetical protein
MKHGPSGLVRTTAGRCVRSFIVLTLAACSGEEPTQPPPDPSIVASVTIVPGRTSLAVGSPLWLIAEAKTAAGTVLAEKTINWASSRPDVATVSSEGLVTGLTTGTTTVTATSDGQSASVALEVEGPIRIVLTSDPGEYIGDGKSYTYTKANAVLQFVNTSQGIFLGIHGDERWDASFSVPNGFQLAPGTYAGAIGSTPEGTRPGMRWGGEGRGCTEYGSFTVDSLIWGSGVGSKLVSIDLTFELHCNNSPPALRGKIHWRDDDPTVPPGPVVPIPETLWRPPPGATPATGNFVYFQSEPGDYVGLGRTTLYQGDLNVFVGNHLVGFEALGKFSAFFDGMNSIRDLKVGYYGNLMRYPFSNPTAGGLEVLIYSGFACNRLSGWFVIDRVQYQGSGLVGGIELRFEQHCELTTPALRGAIRWGQFTG